MAIDANNSNINCLSCREATMQVTQFVLKMSNMTSICFPVELSMSIVYQWLVSIEGIQYVYLLYFVSDNMRKKKLSRYRFQFSYQSLLKWLTLLTRREWRFSSGKSLAYMKSAISRDVQTLSYILYVLRKFYWWGSL